MKQKIVIVPAAEAYNGHRYGSDPTVLVPDDHPELRDAIGGGEIVALTVSENAARTLFLLVNYDD